MPWKIEQRDNEYCVIKESDGSSEGCHSTREEAEEQRKALYASESEYSKETTDPEITPPATLPPEEAEKSLMKSVADFVKGWFTKKVDENVPAFQLTKDAGGRYSWVARYSNNFRDHDTPSDIIASESHIKFAALVKEGIVPAPELWIWHRPEWKWGTGTWAVYDDSGFAMAGGLVDPGKEFVAEAFMKAKDIRVSHSAPLWSVTRSVDDPSIVIEHITEEVSPLPGWAAANKWTGFLVSTESGMYNKENDMLDPTQKAELMKNHGISQDLLDKLEKLNEKEAAAVSASGVQSKELTDATPPTPAEVPQPTPPVEPGVSAVSKEAENALMVQVVTAITDLAGVVKELRGDVEALKVHSTDVTNKAVEKASSTPVASLAQMMIASVVGAKETQVDGRSALAKSGPVEAKPVEPKQQPTPFPLINSFIAGSQREVVIGD